LNFLTTKKLTQNNQELNVLLIVLTKEDYKKFHSINRFKGKFQINIKENNMIYEYEFFIGNFELSYDVNNVDAEGDDITVNNVKMIIYPYYDFYFKKIER